MESGPDGRVITWTAFNKVKRIDGNGSYAEFSYDASRARYKQKTPTATTYYAGALYERVIELDSSGNPTGNATHRFHIFAGGSAVAVYSCTTSCGQDPQGSTADGTKDETLYLHRDHLGSIVAITDGTPTDPVTGELEVLERFTYSAWGVQRRWEPTANGGLGDLIEASSEKQTRGYTGHEMLDELGLINMNGRVYDQHLGRFLSADPFVQFPHSTQGYNRYAYVGNNPLTFTDPSGYLSTNWQTAIFGINDDTSRNIVGGVFFGVMGAVNPALEGRILGYAAPFFNFIPFCQAWCTATASAASGYLQGASVAQSARAGALSYASAYIAGAIGDMNWHPVAAGFAHGISQGALSVAGGGRFGDGFLGGFVGHMAGSYMPMSSNHIAQTIQVAIVGGTVAKLGGGRFANGAITAAMVHMFNCASHGCPSGRLDKAGQPKPPGDYVIGRHGYWQTRKAALLELMDGPSAQASDLPVPQNAPACVQTCTAIGVLESLATGSATDNVLTVSADKAIDITKESATLLEASPRSVHQSVGRVLSKYIVPLRLANVGIEYPWIKAYCQAECNAPVEF